MEKEEYFKQWSEKLSIPIEQIQKEFDKTYAEEEKENSEASVNEKISRALKKLYLQYKKQINSPAEGFEGIIVGAEEPMDVIAKKRREAVELFNQNPQYAVQQGITDEEGNPLDTIEVFSTGRVNPNYGKPLPEKSLMRKIYGICVKKSEGKPKPFQMTQNGTICEKEVPLMKPISFMAIEKTTNDSGFTILNASSFTDFKEIEQLEGNPDIKDLIKNFFSPIQVSELEEYHEKNLENYNRFVCVEGDVVMLSLEPTSIGSRIMQIENTEENLDLDAKPVTCWVPQHVNIDFGEGSKVYIFGRTNQGFKKDEQGNVTSEKGDITIGVAGIYPIEKFKLPETEQINEI